jgi:hypothetical protein
MVACCRGRGDLVGFWPHRLAGRATQHQAGRGRTGCHPSDGPGCVAGSRHVERVASTGTSGTDAGVATVQERIGVPEEAPLRLDAVPLRPGQVRLVRRESLVEKVLEVVRRIGR